MGSSYSSLCLTATAGLQEKACLVSTLSHMHDFDNAGVIPRVLNDLFTHIDEEATIRFCVRVSFIEIYLQRGHEGFVRQENARGHCQFGFGLLGQCNKCAGRR